MRVGYDQRKRWSLIGEVGCSGKTNCLFTELDRGEECHTYQFLDMSKVTFKGIPLEMVYTLSLEGSLVTHGSQSNLSTPLKAIHFNPNNKG